MLDVDITSIEYETKKDQHVDGTFRIKSRDRRPFWCKLFPDHPRILTDLAEQSGARSARIRYRIDVRGLSEGERVDGRITLVSEEGEQIIPVHVLISGNVLSNQGRTIASLEDFNARLETDTPQRALKLFRSEEFGHMIATTYPEHLALYRGLCDNPVTLQKMEEFLVLTGQKPGVEISAVCRKNEFYSLKESVSETILIKKNVRGIFTLNISTDASFIDLPKTRLTQEDFVGSYCSLDFIIRQDQLGEGKRYGAVMIEGCGKTIQIDLVASAKRNHAGSQGIARRREVAEILSRYLTYIRGGRKSHELEDLMMPLLKKRGMKGEDGDVLTVLEAWIYHEIGDQKQRNACLQSLDPDVMESSFPELKAVFQYLLNCSGLMPGRQSSDPAAKIRGEYEQHTDSPILLRLYALTDDNIPRLPGYQLKLMERTFDAGSHSPILYEMVLELILKDYSLLEYISSFTEQVLLYAVRTDQMTEDLMMQVTYMTDSVKGFSEGLYRVLASGYASYPANTSLLDAICRLFMKGPAHDPRSFEWYSLAVESGRNMTRLYEFYMETISENYRKILPKVIRRYFLLTDSLSEKNRAFLYANVIRNRKEDPETFEAYEAKIREFSKEAFRRGRIDSNLAGIYKVMLPDLSNEDAGKMAEMIMTSQVFCDDEHVRFVVVVHRELNHEEIQPLTRGSAMVHLYSEDAQILFEDSMQRRFRANAAYGVQPLMEEEEFLKEGYARGIHTTGYILNRIKKEPISDANRYLYLAAEQSDAFTEEWKREVRKKLLSYYAAHEASFVLEEEIALLQDTLYAEADLSLLIQVLLQYRQYDRVFSLITRYGSETVEDGMLVRLISRLIDDAGEEKDDEILTLAERAFRRGKYDERILSYLCAYFEGAMEDMLAVRSAAEEFYVNTSVLDARIITRSALCRIYVPEVGKILRNHVNYSSNQREIRACIDVTLEYLFDQGEVMEEELVPLVRERMTKSFKDRLLQVSMLMYYASRKNLTDAEEEEAEELMELFMEEDLRFGFYRNLPEAIRRRFRVEDSVFIECNAQPDDRVMIYYRIESSADRGNREYQVESMKRVFRGLYQKVFTLFYGERLIYYTEVIHEGEAVRSGEMTLTAPKTDPNGTSRYQRINRMLKLLEQNKGEELSGELYDYRKTEEIMRGLFAMEEEL